MSIRTTVTLDEDVFERLKAESIARGKPFRHTLNEVLRTGLLTANASPQKRQFRIPTASFGLKPELSYDNTEELISSLEGQDHR